ncbi:hypothetical protein ABIQ69_00390 [Agromyces sp. G08B096]|uniref:Uncharacterized protein n=1 Tax=Agromyces sp. G08B096 TaxID=3156399 RepID=A0AAU7W917_9MICO
MRAGLRRRRAARRDLRAVEEYEGMLRTRQRGAADAAEAELAAFERLSPEQLDLLWLRFAAASAAAGRRTEGRGRPPRAARRSVLEAVVDWFAVPTAWTGAIPGPVIGGFPVGPFGAVDLQALARGPRDPA